MDIDELGRLLEDVTSGRRTLEALERVLGELGRADLTRALQSIAERAQVAEERGELAAWTRLMADLLVRWASASQDPIAGHLASVAADIYRSDLQDPETAEQARVVAAVRSLNPVALAALAEPLESGQDEETRLHLWRVLAALADGEMRHRYEARIAEAHRERDARLREQARQRDRLSEARRMLEDPSGAETALGFLDQHLQEAPGDLLALHLVVQACEALGRTSEIEGRFRTDLERLDAPLRAAVLSELARVQREVLGLPERAAETALEALTHDRAHPAALQQRLEALKQLGREQEALKELEQRRASLAGSSDEARLLPILARAQTAAGRDVDAERTWRRLRAVDPRNIEALRFYEEFHRNRGDYQTLFTTLQFLLSVLEDPQERYRVNRTMAEIAEEHLQSPERAIEAWKRILAGNPMDREAEAALVSLYERTRKWHALLEFYNERVRQLPTEAVEEKVACLRQVIRIFEDPDRLPSPDNVLATWARILEVQPDHPEALETLVRGYREKERWHDLLKVLQKKAQVTSDREVLLDLLRQIADIALTRMSNEAQAVPFLERILEIDPQQLEVIQRLKAIYQRKHSPEKLFQVLLREANLLQGADREPVLLAAATMARDRLLRFDESLRLFEELYRQNPRLREARESLHQLYIRQERWEDYVRFLREEVDRPMPVRRRLELLHKCGEICLERLGDVPGARLLFEQALAVDPEDEVAVRRLEQIYLNADDFPALRRMYLARQDPRSLLGLLIQAESRETDPLRRVALNLTLAQVCEEDLGEEDRAVRFLEKAFLGDPTLTDVGRKLLHLYEAQGDRERIATIIPALAPNLPDAEERWTLWSRLMETLGQSGDLPGAFRAGEEAVRNALALDRVPETLEQVRLLVQRGGLWQEYGSLLRELADATMDHEVRQGVLLELGRLLKERLLFHDEARAVLERVLDLEPGDPEALNLLEEIASQQEDWKALEFVLRRRLDVCRDDRDARDIRMRLGRLYEDLLMDDAAAADCYRDILQGNPKDAEALAGLHRTYERLERFLDLSDIIRMELAIADTPWQKGRLSCELAQICWERLDAVDDALRLLEEALHSEGHSAEALRQLRILFDRRLARDAAANLMAPFLRSQGRTDDLLDLLQARLEDMIRPEAAAALLMEMADLREHGKEDPEGAFKLVMAAVMRHPAEPWVQRFRELADRTGRHRDVAVTLGRWVGVLPPGIPLGEGTIPDPALESKYALLLGELYGEKLGQRDLAIKALEKALPFAEEEEGLLLRLLDLYQQMGDEGAVLRTFDRLAEITEDPVRRRKVLSDRARWTRMQGNLQGALEAWMRVLDLGPDEEAADQVEEILGGQGRHRELLDLLRRREEWVQAPEARSAVQVRAARILGGSLGQWAEAAEVYRKAITEDPAQESLVAEVVGVATSRGLPGWREWAPSLLGFLEEALRDRSGADALLLQVLQAEAELAASPWERVRACVAMADVTEAQGDLEAALHHVSEALRAVPEDPEIADRLIRIGEALDRPQEVLRLLEEIAGTARLEGRTHLLLKAARLWRTRQGDIGRAETIYRRLLELQPGSLEVLREVDDLLREQGKDADRIPLLTEMAALASQTDERRRIQETLGVLCQAKGDFEQATRSFRYVLDRRPEEDSLDPLALEAAHRLISLLGSLGKTREALEVHLLIGGTSALPEERRDHLLEAARTFRDVLREPEEAARVFDRILESFPEDHEAWQEAKSIAVERRDRDRLLRMLQQQIDLARDPEGKAAALVERADFFLGAGEIGFVDALRDLKAVMDMLPSFEPALDRLEVLTESLPGGMEAARQLRWASRKTGDHRRLVRALRVLVERCENPSEVPELNLELADALKRSGEGEAAVQVLRQTWLRWPENEQVVASLAALLREGGEPLSLEAWTEEIAISQSDLSARSRVRRIGARELARMGFLEPAIGLFERNVQDWPGDTETLRVWLEVLEQEGRSGECLPLLEVLARETPDPGERLHLWQRAARLAEEGAGDARRAWDCWWEVLAIQPDHPEALDHLEGLALALGDPGDRLRLDRHRLGLLLRQGGSAEDPEVWEIRRRIAATTEALGLGDEATEAALALLERPGPDPADLDVARSIYGAFDGPPEVFTALVAAAQRIGASEMLLDLYRFTAALDRPFPSREEALSWAVEIEEGQGRDDLLVEDLSELLKIRPGDAALRGRLEMAARRSGALEGYRSALEDCLLRLEGQDEAFQVALELARLHEEDRQDLEAAADSLKVANQVRPDDLAVRERLADLLQRLGRFGELAILWEDVAERLESPEQRLAILFKVQDILRLRLRDARGTERVLQRILDLDPGNRAALDGLESMAREGGDHQALATWLSRKWDVAESQAEKRSLALELARLQQAPLGDSQGAQATLRRLLEEDPRCLEAWSLLEQWMLSGEQWEDLAEVYEKQAAVEAGDASILLLKKAVGLRQGRMGDGEGARRLLRRILDQDPGNDFAFERMSELLEAEQDFEGMVALFHQRLPHVDGAKDRAALNLRIGTIQARFLGREVEALEHLKAALELDPFLPEAPDVLWHLVDSPAVGLEAALVLEEALAHVGDHEGLARVLERQVEMLAAGPEREGLLLRLADLWNSALGDPRKGLLALGRLLTEVPGHSEALQQAVRIADEARIPDVLVEMLTEVAAAHSSPAECRGILLVAADALEGAMALPARAAEVLEGIIGDGTSDEEVLGRLERIYGTLGHQEGMLRVLRRRIQAAGSDAPVDLRLRLASLLSQIGGDSEEIVEELARVLARDPRQEEAIRLLSTMTSDPLAGDRALEILREAFRASEDSKGLLWVLETIMGRAGESDDVVSLHEEAAAAAHRLGSSAVEVEHLGKALALAPADEQVLLSLLKATRRGGHYRNAFGYLVRAARNASWPELEKSLLLQAAGIAPQGDVPADDLELALTRILELDPVCREALDGLEALYERQGLTRQLVEVLEKRLRLNLTPEERAQTLGRLARLAEEQGETRRAFELQEERATHEASPEVLAETVRLARVVGDPAVLVRSLESLADALGTGDQAVSCLLEAASIQENDLGDRMAAVALLEKVLTIEPDNGAAFLRLERLYEDIGDWESLVRMLQEQVESEENPDRKVELLTRTAAIQETHLENLPAAIASIRRAMTVDPDDVSLLDEAIRLHYRAEEWTALIQALRRKASLLPNPAEQVPMLLQAAEITLQRLGDHSLAGALAQQVLQVDPNHPGALLVMARWQESQGQHDEALTLYERLMSLVPKGDDRIQALLGSVRIRSARGQRGPEVISALQEVVHARPADQEALQLLKRLYQEAGQWQPLIELLTRELKAAQTDEQRASLCMDIAEIYLQELNNGARFLQWAEEAHRFQRDNSRVVGGIVRYHLQSREPHRAVPYLEWLVNWLEGKKRYREIPPYAYELGRILEAMGETERAIQSHRLAWEHDSGHLPNALALGRLLLARKDHAGALRVYQPLLLRLDSLERGIRVDVLLSLARIHIAGGDPRKARQFVLRVLAEEPENAEAKALLRAL
ncbi:MAG TPA: tetratricopeptide repeat protein [Myxococcota bacterium]|nr:tetratricopeptide repeat protein [Myxococcota bacterium]HQK50724.1 tetratricopeptide repeat protein [Myxococcota bacterium]